MMAINEEKMARNPAAIAESCAPVPPTLAGMARGSQASPQTFSERLKAAEPMLRRLVPSLALVFVVVIDGCAVLLAVVFNKTGLADEFYTMNKDTSVVIGDRWSGGHPFC